MKSVLTIAASDSSGGAGVQADLKAFSYAGVHGCSVITCVTAQNTEKVSHIYEVPLEVIEAQLDAVLEDIKISACKTGMLYSPEIVELVARKCEAFDFPVVVDPVMKATVGQSLHRPDFIDALTKTLIPKATLVTPNIPEAEAITGSEIKTLDDIKTACRRIHALGCRNVLMKGGHLDELKATDVLFDGEDFRLYLSKSYPKDLHGTGCTFSALITAFLARGRSLEDAVDEAKLHIGNVIELGYKIGKGVGVANVMPQQMSEDQLQVMRSLANAVNELLEVLPPSMVPEVGVNIGHAVDDAKDIQDICAIEGRLIRAGEAVAHLGRFKFGASKHVARIILTAMKFDGSMRSVMNIRFDEKIIDACTSLGFSIGKFDRRKEPETTSTMEWGTESAIEELDKVPDIVYDEGGIGKEPMIRILGRDPNDVIGKLRQIVERYEA